MAKAERKRIPSLVLPRGIRQRGSSFLVDVSVGGKRRTRTCSNLRQAYEAREDMLRDLNAGEDTLGPQQVWTLQQAFDYTCQHTWRDAKSALDLIRKAQQMVDHFGADTKLNRITRQEIDSFISKQIAAGKSNATINRKLSALSRMLSSAVDAERLHSKPKVPILKEKAGRIRWLSDIEETALCDTLLQWDKHDHLDAVRVLLYTGLRTGELWNLRVPDIDFRTGMITIWENKADHPRSVPMTKLVRSILERRRPLHRPFPYRNEWLRPVWDRARQHLGYGDDDQFVPHMLRHTCASRLVQRGVSLRVVQEWLGHKSMATTMRYAHLAPANLTSAAALLEGNVADDVAAPSQAAAE